MHWSRMMTGSITIAVISLIGLSACNEPDNMTSGPPALQYGLDETCDETRDGVRLVMYYDAPSETFLGTLGNTTEDIVQQIRVRLRLSNGADVLTPHFPLDPGEEDDVFFDVSQARSFTTWDAYPVVGP